MRKSQMIGLLLWRGGWLLVWSMGAFAVVRLLLTALEIPAGIRAGIGLVATGAVLVMGSVILERVQDFRNEPAEEP
jgi:hypothetical protein